MKTQDLKTQFKKRRRLARKDVERFLKKNVKWLEGTFDKPMVKRRSSGESIKSFEESCERSKHRETIEVISKRCVSACCSNISSQYP